MKMERYLPKLENELMIMQWQNQPINHSKQNLFIRTHLTHWINSNCNYLITSIGGIIFGYTVLWDMRHQSAFEIGLDNKHLIFTLYNFCQKKGCHSKQKNQSKTISLLTLIYKIPLHQSLLTKSQICRVFVYFPLRLFSRIQIFLATPNHNNSRIK